MSMLNTQATNWQIDYGQNKAGAIYGNAIQNLGGMTGNLIMEYAQKQKEKAEKDAKEQEAIKYLTAKGGMSEEEAKGVVKGVGVDNFMKMQQIDLDRQQIAQLLLDHVADHAFGLRAQHVQRIGLDLLVSGALQRQQTHLRPVAVADHEVMLQRHRRQGLCGDPHVAALVLGRQWLAASQQRVAAQGGDD